MKSVSLAFGAAAALLMGAAASAQTFDFFLDGQQEAPLPVITPGSGVGRLVVNPITRDYHLAVAYSGLIGSVTNNHIHRAPPGVAGPVVVSLPIPPANPIDFNGNFSQANYADLLAGNLYVNIHSSAFPGGEIRGQIVPAPAGAALLGLGGLVATRRRRR